MPVATWVTSIHPMDNNGSLHFEVDQGDHILEYFPWWENCGLAGETIKCSCGFESTEHSGNGCWQWGHDEPCSHRTFDNLHATMLTVGLEVVQEQGLGYPALIQSLARLAE